MDNKKTLFMQLQFCMLLAALTVLPSFDFGDFMSRATGVGLFGADSIWVIICKLVGAIGACLAIFKLYKAEPGNQKPMIVYILGGLGSILVVLSIFGISAVGTIGLIALIIAMIMACKSLEISWNSAGTSAALLIIYALVMFFFVYIEQTLCTRIVCCAGIIIYLVALGKLKSALDSDAESGVSKLKTSAILAICGVVLGWIPVVGWAFELILNILAFIFGLLGYSRLKSTPSIGTVGQQGAGNLFLGMILMLVAVIVDIIPAVGGTIAAILAIVTIGLAFIGWKRIATGIEENTGKPEPEQAPKTEQPAPEPAQ